MNNILCIGDTNMNFFKYKIGSPNLEYLIKKHRPDVLILDPLQSFVPDHVNLIARNHVRPMFDWLNVMTKKYEFTIKRMHQLVVVIDLQIVVICMMMCAKY